MTQFDPELGEQPDTNRPTEPTGSHGAPRLWDGARLQARDFLDPDALGQVVHHCGDGPCSASNPGE